MANRLYLPICLRMMNMLFNFNATAMSTQLKRPNPVSIQFSKLDDKKPEQNSLIN